MSRILFLAKATLVWAAIVLEMLVGVIALAVLERRWGYPSSTSEWFFVASAGLFGLVSVIASVTATRNPKRAGLVLLFATPVGWLATFLVGLERLRYGMILWYVLLWYSLLSTLIFLVLPALFWFEMDRLKWAPMVLQGEARSRNQKIVRSLRTVTMTLILVLVASVVLDILIPPFNLDCNKRSSISRFAPGNVIFVGKVVGTLGPCKNYAGRHFCNGAIALVNERFSGVTSRFELLTEGFFEDGQTYLIDGIRSDGPLTRFIPLVRFRPCNDTARIEDSAVNLRVLREGIPTTDVRIIGEVTRYDGRKRQAAPGIDVTIDGPFGITSVSTDRGGIYDFNHLPPGRYQIYLEKSDSVSSYGHCGSGQDLKSGDTGGCTLFLDR
jgi:hypothetical protein